MTLLKSPKIFDTRGKDKIEVIVKSIEEYEELGYKIAGVGYSLGPDEEIEAGYEITISGATNGYWRNGEKVRVEENLHILLTVNSSPIRHEGEKGIIGGAVFESPKFLKVELNVEPRCVKDIVEELRREPKKGFRIDGYAISPKVFRVVYFLLFDQGS